MAAAFADAAARLLAAGRRPLLFANDAAEARALLSAVPRARAWGDDGDGPLVVNKQTHAQGINMQHHADAIVCRPTPGDVLEQMKGRVDRPGQKQRQLLLTVLMAEVGRARARTADGQMTQGLARPSRLPRAAPRSSSKQHTVEEAEAANIRLCGAFFRDYLAPLARRFTEISVEAALEGGDAAGGKGGGGKSGGRGGGGGGRVRKAFLRLLHEDLEGGAGRGGAAAAASGEEEGAHGEEEAAEAAEGGAAEAEAEEAEEAEGEAEAEAEAADAAEEKDEEPSAVGGGAPATPSKKGRPRAEAARALEAWASPAVKASRLPAPIRLPSAAYLPSAWLVPGVAAASGARHGRALGGRVRRRRGGRVAGAAGAAAGAGAGGGLPQLRGRRRWRRSGRRGFGGGAAAAAAVVAGERKKAKAREELPLQHRGAAARARPRDASPRRAGSRPRPISPDLARPRPTLA